MLNRKCKFWELEKCSLASASWPHLFSLYLESCAVKCWYTTQDWRKENLVKCLHTRKIIFVMSTVLFAFCDAVRTACFNGCLNHRLLYPASCCFIVYIHYYRTMSSDICKQTCQSGLETDGKVLVC